MSESAPPSEVSLEALPLPVPGGGTLFPGWASGLARRDPESSIVWFFRLDSETALPRGYRDSLRQRHLQWTDLKGLSDKARLFWTGILGFDPPVRAQKLRDEAKAHGIERCALAEEWAAPPKPLVPPMPMQQ